MAFGGTRVFAGVGGGDMLGMNLGAHLSVGKSIEIQKKLFVLCKKYMINKHQMFIGKRRVAHQMFNW